ncbi:MAPK regulated corepressor interacting protein 2 [Lepisosteus oculatus]|uniref:MAPK regulated corepressor interacting protein 2 n=1 Tax=Lepisosteus oculatus TaxID=7918 RepID=UPI0003EA96EF|nr:PREDICTED: protein FAM195A [Lepisosteus oculatus]XP_015215388.1 PREDICTED: protein FAM195A [Lepisosteus oculatus]
MMYTITRGPSKLVTQRRTGPTQQIENKINDLKHKQAHWSAAHSPAPKLVFNRLNGKKTPTLTPQTDSQGEGYTPAHEENVKFVYEAWQDVEQRMGDGRQAENGQGPVQYTEKSPSPSTKNFVPIDLDEWWAQRFLANIVNLS